MGFLLFSYQKMRNSLHRKGSSLLTNTQKVTIIILVKITQKQRYILQIRGRKSTVSENDPAIQVENNGYGA